MADLTPDEQRALQTALVDAGIYPGTVFTQDTIVAWRAARTYQAKQDALICHVYAVDQRRNKLCGLGGHDCAAAIRERAKGLK